MQYLLKLEFVALLALSIVLFLTTDVAWWWFPLLILVPDISMIGYIVNTRIGALTYNIVHTLIFGIAVFIFGYFTHLTVFEVAGAILIGHSAMDRAFGYGLKFGDSFKHTHLGNL